MDKSSADIGGLQPQLSVSCGGFPNQGYLFGGFPITRVIVSGGPILGSPYFGKTNMCQC